MKALKATTVALNPSWMDMTLADDDDDDGLEPTQSKLPDMVRQLMSPSGMDRHCFIMLSMDALMTQAQSG